MIAEETSRTNMKQEEKQALAVWMAGSGNLPPEDSINSSL